MSASKITPLHIYIAGFVVALLVGAGMFFGMIKPLNEANTALAGQVASTESTQVQIDAKSFTIAQADAAKKELEATRNRRNSRESTLKALEARKQLSASSRIDIGETEQDVLARTMPRWLMLPRVVVPMMEKYAQQQAAKYGVEVATQFAAPAPSTDPSMIPREIIIWNMGGMRISGPFNNVMRWAESWNQAPLLVSVDGLKCSLADRGGKVSATAALTVYIFPTGKGATMPGAAPAGGMAPGMDPSMMGGMDPGMGGGMNGGGGGNGAM